MNHILEAISKAGGEPIRIGGCVRDKLLGSESKDVDIEVYGLPAHDLANILRNFGKVNFVGESFGVIKLTTADEDFDFSLPRRDNKVGRGHRGFQVGVDHDLTPAEAAARRDFTINAIGEKLDGTLVDPFNGVADLKNKILRATSEHFSEDPLRVLRGFQFTARFGLIAEPKTLGMCATLKDEAATIAIERIWMEWEKWALKGVHPSLGIKFLVDCGWINLFPELVNMISVPQDPEYHPEGSVMIHSMHVCDAAARICDRENLQGEDRITIILAALCHDLGKAYPWHGGTTEFTDGRWRSPGHAEAGVPIARKFLESIGCLERIIERVLPLVAEHMICVTSEMNPRVVRRLCVRLDKATLRELLYVIEADHSGRPPLPGGLPDSAADMIEIAEKLALEAAKPKPYILGRHLIARGMVPGPIFKEIINKCFEAQLDGIFAVDDAENYLDKLLAEDYKG